jgi:hypothetical protein
MAHKRRDGTRSAILTLGLALGGGLAQNEATAQQGPPLSTGSGVGTGAGGAMSSANTGAGGAMSTADTGAGGAMSGRGGVPSLDYGRALPLGPRQGTVPFGPGVDVSFPTDTYLVPFLLPQEAANPVQGKVSSQITVDLLQNARQIADPAERSLALRQIANGAIASNQMVLAHHTLEESITASSQVTVPLVRDQRLIGLVVSLNTLADALLRVGRENQNMTATAEEAQAAGLEPLPKSPESTVLIRIARLEWRRAEYLALLINNPTYRNEMLYRIAEDEAVGSSTIANDFPRGADIQSLGNRPAPVRVPGAGPNPPIPSPPGTLMPPYIPGRRTMPGQTPTSPPNRPAPNANQPAPPPAPAAPAAARPTTDDATFLKLADEVLVDAWDVARAIDRLIWKNRAMVRIALSASDSEQFTRGVELSRTIDNAESRSEALLLLAEAMCRPEHNRPEEATAAYQGAAEAVASIPQGGLRGVMTGFLIDSLIAAGRFDDARACTVIYPEESERFVALGAVAEAQGRRGLADSARIWIAEAPEAYRAALNRRVVAGILMSVENQRSKEMDLGAEPGPAPR